MTSYARAQASPRPAPVAWLGMTGANGRRVVVFSDPRPSRYRMCLGGSLGRAQQLWIRTCLDSLELGLREIHDPSSSWGALSNETAAVMTDDELRRAGYAPEMNP